MPVNLSEAFIIENRASKVWDVLGTRMRCRVGSDETEGAYSIVENLVPPQNGAPPHLHHDEDEIAIVLEGEFEIICGGRTYTATKGAVAYFPRTVPHAFRNIGDTDGQLLVTITPGGFENFFAELSREAPETPPDAEKIAALGRKYNIEFLPA